MELHSVNSVEKADEEGVYIVLADITDKDGARSEVVYVSRPEDHFGLADDIRQAVDNWITAGKPVSDT